MRHHGFRQYPVSPATAFFVAALGLGVPTRALAQQTPVVVTVIQVAGSTVYVDAGASAGLAEGMTVDARTGDGALLGSLVVLGVTDDGAGLTFAGAVFPLTRGQRLVLELPDATDADAQGAAAPVGEGPEVAGPGEGTPGGPAARPASFLSGLRVSGSAGVELEVHRASTSWAEQVDGVVTDQLVRPSFRLRGAVSGLPADFTIATDLRVWHRGTSQAAYDPGTTLRVYRASVARETGAIRVRAGRFWAPEMPFAAYWDGVMARFGGLAGAGLALGFTPRNGAEGLDSNAPKLAAFVDYETPGAGPSARGAVSFVQRRLSWADTTVRTIGWNQRARWGAASLINRMEYELGAGLSHGNVDLAVDLPVGVRVTGGWLRDRFRPLARDTAGTARVRERVSAGVSWYGVPGGLDVRASLLTGDDEGYSLDGTFTVAPLRPGMPTVSLASSYWSGPDRSWLFVSPSVRRRFGIFDVRAAYHHYRLEDALSVNLNGGDATVAFPVAGLQLRFGAQGEWGSDLATLRLRSSVWYRF